MCGGRALSHSLTRARADADAGKKKDFPAMQKPLKNPNMDFLPAWDVAFVNGLENELLYQVILVSGGGGGCVCVCVCVCVCLLVCVLCVNVCVSVYGRAREGLCVGRCGARARVCVRARARSRVFWACNTRSRARVCRPRTTWTSSPCWTSPSRGCARARAPCSPQLHRLCRGCS